MVFVYLIVGGVYSLVLVGFGYYLGQYLPEITEKLHQKILKVEGAILKRKEKKERNVYY